MLGLTWVSDLKLPGVAACNYKLIDKTFTVVEAKKIKSILISSICQSDKLVWSGEKVGKYFVKSGYKLLLEPTDIDGLKKKLYNQLWSLNCPAKIRILVWKFL